MDGEPKMVPETDLRALKSSMDVKIAELSKQLEEKNTRIAELDAIAVDDRGLAKLKTEFETTKADWVKKMDEDTKAFRAERVTFYRERFSKEFGLDPKELEKLEDPKDMELYGLRKKNVSGKSDREPNQTGIHPANRLRAGLEKAFKVS